MKRGPRVQFRLGRLALCKACATKTTEIPKSPLLPSSRQSHDKKMAIYKSRQTPNLTLTAFISDFPTFRSIQNKPVLLIAHPEYSLNKQTRYKQSGQTRADVNYKVSLLPVFLFLKYLISRKSERKKHDICLDDSY